MPALITGATGLIGRKLASRLGGSVVLTRDPARAAGTLPGCRAYLWSSGSTVPPEALEDVDVVYNLAGESISDGRWSYAKKRRIFESRIVGTRNLVTAIENATHKPKVLISGSAIGIYGDRGDEPIDESSHIGDDFLAHVCAQWEIEARRAASFGVRVVTVRTGVVLAREGGALPRLAAPFEWGVGGPLGCGIHWMSWIHIDDEVSLLQFCAATAGISGVVNATAPQPVRNGDFAEELGRVLHRKSYLPVPGLLLRLAVGEAASVILSSVRAYPETATRLGFIFAYPDVRVALSSLYK